MRGCERTGSTRTDRRFPEHRRDLGAIEVTAGEQGFGQGVEGSTIFGKEIQRGGIGGIDGAGDSHPQVLEQQQIALIGFAVDVGQGRMAKP